jgi:hypothetical protein
MAGTKPASTIPVDDLVNEAEKVKAQIQELANALTNPELNLGASVLLNVQRRELEAYLCGLLYALGEAAPDNGTSNSGTVS